MFFSFRAAVGEKGKGEGVEQCFSLKIKLDLGAILFKLPSNIFQKD